jgi:3-methyladenine DNA glycosylase Mpg
MCPLAICFKEDMHLYVYACICMYICLNINV